MRLCWREARASWPAAGWPAFPAKYERYFSAEVFSLLECRASVHVVDPKHGPSLDTSILRRIFLNPLLRDYFFSSTFFLVCNCLRCSWFVERHRDRGLLSSTGTRWSDWGEHLQGGYWIFVLQVDLTLTSHKLFEASLASRRSPITNSHQSCVTSRIKFHLSRIMYMPLCLEPVPASIFRRPLSLSFPCLSSSSRPPQRTNRGRPPAKIDQGREGAQEG